MKSDIPVLTVKTSIDGINKFAEVYIVSVESRSCHLEIEKARAHVLIILPMYLRCTFISVDNYEI